MKMSRLVQAMYIYMLFEAGCQAGDFQPCLLFRLIDIVDFQVV